MTKRFSWLAFAIVTALHLWGDWLVVAAWPVPVLDQPPIPHLALLTAITWLWIPLPMLLRSHVGGPQYAALLAILWSLIVGAFVGFVVPHVISWRRRSLNGS